MSWTRLNRTEAPSGSPVSVTQVQDWLRLESDDEAAIVSDLILAATDFVEGPSGIGRALRSQKWEMTLDHFPRCIEIPLSPVTSIDSIKYIDQSGVEQTLAADQYRVDVSSEPARIEPTFGNNWPTTRRVINAVTVAFTVGYTEVPMDIKQAIALLVAHWFENRMGAGESMDEIPFGVTHILDKYRVGRFA